MAFCKREMFRSLTAFRAGFKSNGAAGRRIAVFAIRTLFAFAVLFLIIITFGCKAEKQPIPLQENEVNTGIEDVVLEVYESNSLPGISVAVLHRGELVFARGFGWADVEAEIPVTSETMFPMGSIEKQFTAAAIMLLVEQGIIGLDEPISKYLTELDTNGHEVTIRQMLNQVSGLQGMGTLEAQRRIAKLPTPPSRQWGPVPDISVGKGFDSNDIAMFKGQPLYYEPGERFSYSQPNYDLLCFVIADLFKKTYYDVLQELADSAGIQSFHAAWTPRPEDKAVHVADGYARTGKKGVNKVWEDNLGSSWTTATGLARWGRALAKGEVVSPESFKEMSTPAKLNDGRRWPYGFGLGLKNFEGRTKFSHSGDVHGFYAGLSYYPEEDLSIAFMTNVEMGWFMENLEPRIARMVLAIPTSKKREAQLSGNELDKYLGTYDAGTLWIDVVKEGDGVYVVLREPDYVKNGFQLFRNKVLYQGNGQFEARGTPDWIHVSFVTDRLPSEIVVHWDGAPIQGIRRNRE